MLAHASTDRGARRVFACAVAGEYRASARPDTAPSPCPRAERGTLRCRMPSTLPRPRLHPRPRRRRPRRRARRSRRGRRSTPTRASSSGRRSRRWRIIVVGGIVGAWPSTEFVLIALVAAIVAAVATWMGAAHAGVGRARPSRTDPRVARGVGGRRARDLAADRAAVRPRPARRGRRGRRRRDDRPARAGRRGAAGRSPAPGSGHVRRRPRERFERAAGAVRPDAGPARLGHQPRELLDDAPGDRDADRADAGGPAHRAGRSRPARRGELGRRSCW